MALSREYITRTILAHRDRLYAYIWSLVGDPHLAEDVLQDLTVLAIEKAESVSEPGALMPWLRTAARLKSLEALRAKRRRPPVIDSLVLDQLEQAWHKLDHLEMAELVDTLQECVEQLGPKSKEIVGMRYNKGMKSSEIARRLDRKVTTVYQALTRTHRALADCLKQKMRLGPDH